MADDKKLPPVKKVEEAPVAEAKFVMMHTQVGAFPQGKVVPASACSEWDIARLLESGAIRVAKPEEMDCDKVSVLVHPSISQEKDAIIDRLTAERNRLQEQVYRLERELDITQKMKAPPPTVDQAKLQDLIKLISEKDIAISTLQNTVNDLKSRLASASNATDGAGSGG